VILRVYGMKIVSDPLLMKIRHFSAEFQLAELLLVADLDLNDEERREVEEHGEILIDRRRAREMGIESEYPYFLLKA